VTDSQGNSRVPRAIGSMVVALVVVVVALVVAAWQPARAGAAAVVDSQRISVTTLEAKTAGLIAARQRYGVPPAPLADLTRDQLTALISSRVLEQAARQLGVNVSPAEIDTRRRELESQLGGPEALASQGALEGVAPEEQQGAIRDLLRYEKIGQALVPDARTVDRQQERDIASQELLTRVSREMQITVNPRYGTWNPDERVVLPAQDDFIAPPAAPRSGGPVLLWPGEIPGE